MRENEEGAVLANPLLPNKRPKRRRKAKPPQIPRKVGTFSITVLTKIGATEVVIGELNQVNAEADVMLEVNKFSKKSEDSFHGRVVKVLDEQAFISAAVMLLLVQT